MKKYAQRLLALACTAVLAASQPAALGAFADDNELPTVSASSSNDAAAEIVYDLNTLSPFKRSRAAVARAYNAAKNAGKGTYQDGKSSTYYSVQASTKAPYCEGTLTDDTLLVMQSMTDFFRRLVGVRPLASYTGQDPSLQYQALDRNFQFDHYINDSSKPSDMSDELWQKGKPCTHNILSMGTSPMWSIENWMNEGYYKGYGFSTFGHRYALIADNLNSISFGYCGSVAVGTDMSYDYYTSGILDTAYCFPAAGNMPAELIEAYYSGWSLDFDSSKLSYGSSDDIKITVTELSTGTSYDCTKANGLLQVSGNSLRFAQPDCSSYYSGDYSVYASGLRDKATGKSAAVKYTVSFFRLSDYKNIDDSPRTLKVTVVEADGKTPAAGASVIFTPDTGSAVSYTADKNGAVTITGIKADTGVITARKSGFADTSFETDTSMNGSVSMKIGRYGDTDLNGVIDIYDLALLQQYIAKWNVMMYQPTADVDRNGKVDVYDLARLQQYLCRWNVKLG